MSKNSNPIHIGIFVEENTFDRGVNDTFDLILKQFPDANITVDKYAVTGQLDLTINKLKDFLSKYPEGRRLVLSQRVSTSTQVSLYLDRNKIDIPTFNLAGASETLQKLNNLLSFAPFAQYSIMSMFQIFIEFQMKQILVIYPDKSLDITTILNFINQVKKQGDILNIPYKIETMEKNKIYPIEDYTNIIMFGNNERDLVPFVDNFFLDQIRSKKSCYISLTQNSDGVQDIFDDIPAFALIPRTINFTPTSEEVYQNLKDKKFFVFWIYVLYDILYKTIDISKTNLPMTIDVFLNNNAFQVNNKLEAGTNALVFNSKINGYQFGSYDALFTKNVLIGDNQELFNKYCGGGVMSLPDSKSNFRCIGIVPFFYSFIYNNDTIYYEIYSDSDVIRVSYDLTVCNLDKFIVITGTNSQIKFLVEFTPDGYFKNLVYLYDNFCYEPPLVNQRMSKKTTKVYLKGNSNQNCICLNLLDKLFGKKR